MAKYNFIKTKTEGKVFYLTLARPAKRNAFTPTMVAEIAHAFESIKNNKSIWLIIIDAEGPVFCAGMDLAVFQSPDLDTKNNEIDPTNLPFNEIFKAVNKPIISKVDGPVIAGGFLIICESTFVVANEKASFSLPEVNRGIFPFQVMNSLRKILPERKILEICVLAKNINAIEAYNLGIVTHLFAESEFEIDLNSLIANILEGAPFAIEKGIEVSKELNSLIDSERNIYLKSELDKLKNSLDAQEGINAFIEKRKPNWGNC